MSQKKETNGSAGAFPALEVVEARVALALAGYADRVNDESLWADVRAHVTDVLEQARRDGLLQGDTAEQSFAVQCGLNVTMSSLDVMFGELLVTMHLAIDQPGEFTILTLSQPLTTGKPKPSDTLPPVPPD